MRRGLWLLAPLLVANVVGAALAQSRVYVLNGVPYRFPAAHAAGVLTAASDTGDLEWASLASSSEWPSNLVVFSPTGSCPTGWTEYTDARGRAIVGLVSGGTSTATVGTALSNSENRAVGQHTHGVTDSGHTHAQDPHTHSVNDPGHSHGGSVSTASASIASDGNEPVSVHSGTTTTSSDGIGVGINDATASNVSATANVTLANAGSVAGTNAPYIQLLACRTP
jgi:hypothetical protein